ncbi:MAG: hypothetical protein A3H51_00975 [Candidatus Spechtbacteria bacterium RIFCSPLOWO2_02_FULL_38_8]|uniref:LemA family protein n=1 Tax=Candidatus Spechtbacteria bacterium RIFCSPLOWO2_02_FULL_38_8 TaxID=1802164 RepID=A0A1G2HJB2_9BACT|nr:MAG: hypothetical protein A3H51_00975 [Candidatus Spechtbacteria bacterium RIFCSPLOWO2_02_FULL_38_8]
MSNRKAIITGIFVFVALWLVVVAIWGLGVATAGIYGRGEAHKDIQSADFRIQAYQTFFNQCASIQGLEGQIDELTTALEYYQPGSREYNITVTSIAGVKGARHQAIARYNQDALKDWTEGQFRDADLPYQIPDTNYPEGGKTRCAIR